MTCAYYVYVNVHNMHTCFFCPSRMKHHRLEPTQHDALPQTSRRVIKSYVSAARQRPRTRSLKRIVVAVGAVASVRTYPSSTRVYHYVHMLCMLNMRALLSVRPQHRIIISTIKVPPPFDVLVRMRYGCDTLIPTRTAFAKRMRPHRSRRALNEAGANKCAHVATGFVLVGSASPEHRRDIDVMCGRCAKTLFVRMQMDVSTCDDGRSRSPAMV